MSTEQDLCGWIPPEERTKEQNELHEQVVSEMPEFKISGSTPIRNGDKFPLFMSPKAMTGDWLPYVWQAIGSCVGAGGANALRILAYVEIHLGKESEVYKLIFWIYLYGMSRKIAGLRGRGSGSFGAAWVKAAKEYGSFAADLEGLPEPGFKQGHLWYGSRTELDWSNGAAIDDKWHVKAKEHRIANFAPLNDDESIVISLKNGYPITIACGFGQSGTPRVAGSGTNKVRLSSFSNRMAHQQSIDAYWDHPELGPIVHVQNQWGPKAHGDPVDDSPPGGYWVKLDRIAQIARHGGEVFSISGFEGFVAQELNYDLW